ncbi:MAG: hypothetical protein Q7U86_06390, partial [Draconibacterium sp.]|nr:hypothetical protein [Draconibacterium sp.]
GHTMVQQIVSYEELFSYVKEDGVYLCEDLHTSYWLKYGGGHKRQGTFIEYSKNFIDYLNAYHSEQRTLKVNEFTKSVFSIHYYDSIIVIEKRPIEKPYHEKTGTASFEPSNTPKTLNVRMSDKLINFVLSSINRALRFIKLGGFIWK